MIEVLIGAGILVGVVIALVALGFLLALVYEHAWPLLYYGGVAAVVIGMSYLVGYEVTHGTNDMHWWPWVAIIAGSLSGAVGYDQKVAKEWADGPY